MLTLYAPAADLARITRVRPSAASKKRLTPALAMRQGRELLREGIPCQIRGAEVFVLTADLEAWTRGTLHTPASNQPNWGAINAQAKPRS